VPTGSRPANALTLPVTFVVSMSRSIELGSAGLVRVM
jgi:hypothetical protein